MKHAELRLLENLEEQLDSAPNTKVGQIEICHLMIYEEMRQDVGIFSEKTDIVVGCVGSKSGKANQLRSSSITSTETQMIVQEVIFVFFVQIVMH